MEIKTNTGYNYFVGIGRYNKWIDFTLGEERLCGQMGYQK
jgi:hypothetical protein